MIRRIARPMLASVFVIDGVETLRHPQAHVADAAPLVDKAAPLVEKGEQALNERVTPTVPPVPKDTETLVKALAGVKIGAGVLFAMGKAPRLSALALTASHLPSTISRHAFWTESDSAARSRKATGLATDVSLLGALVLASVDTAGQPGLTWRARKAGDKVAAKLPGARAEAVGAGAAVAGIAHTVADQARDAAEVVHDRAPEVAEQVRGQASGFMGLVRDRAPQVATAVLDRVAAAQEQAAPLAAQAREQAASAVHTAREEAVSAVHSAREEAAPFAAQVRQGAESAADNVVEQVGEIDSAAARKAVKDVRKKSDKLRRKVAQVIQP